MALGVRQDDITNMILELQSLPPDELEQLAGEMQDETDGMSDGHLVNYAMESVREAHESTRMRRDRWDRLWEAHENEIKEYAAKEDWQNAIVLNKPFTTTVQAKAIVRRALMERPDYLNIDPPIAGDPEKELKAKFWGKALKYWCGTRDAHMPTVFADAAGMSFIVGISNGVKILWRQDDNGVYRLYFESISPWNLFYDPDRKPRQPQGGLYCIHQEWVPLYKIYQMAEQGFYEEEQVALISEGTDQRDAAGYGMEDREQERRRKGQLLHRNRYRKDVLVTEFWGGILDEGGHLVMPNSRYTIANGIVIRHPRKVPFPRLRWPIMQFSALPHPLRFDGYGLWEGVMAIWKFQNNVLNLFGDNESFRINNMFEIDRSKLEDTQDLEVFPGKNWARAKNAPSDGKPAVMPVLKGESNIQDMQFIWDMATRQWEEGSFVTQSLKGIQPEQQRTLGELKMNQESSLGVFDSIGKDIEQGGVDLAWAASEVLVTFWDDRDTPNLLEVFGPGSEELGLMQLAGFLMPEARMKQLMLNTDIKIEGISRLIDRSDLLDKLNMMIMAGDNPRFAPFMKDYDICKRLASELAMDDLIYTEDEMQQQQAMIMEDALNRQDQEMAAGGPGGGAPGKPGEAPPPAGKPAGPTKTGGTPPTQTTAPKPAIG